MSRSHPARPCAHPGCRAWAMRGQDYCRAHAPPSPSPSSSLSRTTRDLPVPPTPTPTPTRALAPAHPVGNEWGADPEDQERERFEQRAAGLLAAERSAASLAVEIALLRLLLARVLATEQEVARLAVSVPRIVDSIVRAVRAEHMLLSDEDEEGSAAERMLADIAAEIGEIRIGGDRWTT